MKHFITTHDNIRVKLSELESERLAHLLSEKVGQSLHRRREVAPSAAASSSLSAAQHRMSSKEQGVKGCSIKRQHCIHNSAYQSKILA